MRMSFGSAMMYLFNAGWPWCVVEVLLTALVICLMVRNVETWSDKFKAKQRVPIPLVLVISMFSIVICCVIDFLWNLWSIYDLNGGTLNMLSSFAHDLFVTKIYVYGLVASLILLVSGIYFICLKPYRIVGIIMVLLAVGIFWLSVAAFQPAKIFDKRLSRPTVKYDLG